MKPLSDVNAEKLFVKRIFGSEDQFPSQLKDVSNDILRKYGGLPLAIISMASLLANKPCTKEQWERYRNSIGLEFEEASTVNQMDRILSLSYSDLPYCLKTCLLYLSTFPEDFVIERVPLVRRWIAEGFISTYGGKNLEEVGECYFNELINRNMIQPVEIQYDGHAHACRVHDVILDLIVSKATEETFVSVFGYQNHIWGLQDKSRRLSLNCRDQDYIRVPSTMDLSKARSLTIYGSTEHMPLLSDFQALRVIHIENNDKLENHYFDDIGRLLQLKYLGLRDVSISKLPEKIGELQQLETLDIRGSSIRQLPKSIIQLKKLVLLRAHYFVSLPEGIGNMRGLQELGFVRVDESTPSTSLDELGSLTELRNLEIRWCVSDTYIAQKDFTDSLISSISRLCRFKLRRLHVTCDYENGCSLDFLLDSWSPPPYLLQNFGMRTNYYFPRVPEWVASLPNVTFLNININPVGEQVFRILGGLPSLLALKLFTKTLGPEERLIIDSSGFQCLKEFHFYNWNSAMGPAVFEVGAMPKLEKLVFGLVAREVGSSCSDRYLGLQHIPPLKHLLVEIDCWDASTLEVEATEAAARNVTKHLLDRVQIEIKRLWIKQMVKDEDEGSIKGNI